MNPEIYRQYDNRWGDLPYPGWGAYLSDSGCGCLAVYHCAIELKKYAGSLTVPQCRDYMVQFATVDDGTLWSGITRGLEHYGFTAHWRESDTMDDIFRELEDSCNCGVILFAKKNAASYGPDGTLWTTIGHYIAFSDYKIENGEHKFYMKDSGPRRHDGWYSFEKSMRGCCKNVWICKSTNGQERYNPDDPKPKPEPTPTPTGDTYPGPYPEVKKYLEPGDRGENVIRLQNYLNWYTDGAFFKECGNADGVYGNNTLKYVNKMLTDFFGASEADGLVGPKTIAKMKAYKKSSSPVPDPKSRPAKFPGNYPNVKKYLEPGDRGENVIRLQQYLDWWSFYDFSKECGGADGVYGANTLRWVKKMQAEFFGASEADGLVGSKTIAKMKEVGGADGPIPDPDLKHTEVIDVSSAQSDIDWAKVKASGVVGVMVRCGYRGYEFGILKEDKMFMKHIQGAYKAGLKVGIYFYTQAINYKEGQEEADYAISLLNKSGVNTYYPIAVDTEYCAPEEPGDHPRANDISVEDRTDALRGFCDQVIKRGGEPMVYACRNDFDTKINMMGIPYDIWCAQWESAVCTLQHNLKMWQYTSKGRISGVNGNVDRNRCYITKACPQPSPTPPKPDPKPTPGKKSYSGSYPTAAEIKTASNNGIRKNIADWGVEIAKSGKYHYKSWTEDPNTHKCPICHPGTGDGWNCIGFAWACWHHGGEIPCACHCGIIYNQLGDRIMAAVLSGDNDKALSLVRNAAGVDDIKLITNGGKNIPASWLQPGDSLILTTDGTTYGHSAIYGGNGTLIDSSSQRTPNIDYHAKYSWWGCKVAMRYTGGRTYLKKGDYGDAVLKLQKYVDWYFDGAFTKECGPVDNFFGSNTHKWVVKMQTDFFGAKDADGTVGPKTIAKMKAVKK